MGTSTQRGAPNAVRIVPKLGLVTASSKRRRSRRNSNRSRPRLFTRVADGFSRTLQFAFRWTFRLGFLGFALVVAGLSFSDRAPGFTSARGLWFARAVEAQAGMDLISRGDIPWRFDAVGHFLMWSLAGLLGWFAIGRRDSGLFLIASLSAISAGVEFVQPILSSSRASSYQDLIANVLGITLGVVGGWMLSMSFEGFRWVRGTLSH